jgi:hypothetical protein
MHPLATPANVRFFGEPTTAAGLVRESGAVGRRRSIGLRCPMATASIELALWKSSRHAHAAGYVCTTYCTADVVEAMSKVSRGSSPSVRRRKQQTFRRPMRRSRCAGDALRLQSP